MSSLNIRTDTLQTDRIDVDHIYEKTASAGITLENNTLVDANLTILSNFYITTPPQTGTDGLAPLKELMLDTSNNRLVTRKYLMNDYREFDERFYYNSTNWAVVPNETIDIPILDDIISALSAPLTLDTVGCIVSTYPWRIRSNNLDDVNALNLDNGGLYMYIHNNISTKHYAITRPFFAEGQKIYYEISVALNQLTTDNSSFFGIINSNAVFAVDGSNFNTTTWAFGFAVAYVHNNNYNIQLIMRNNGTTSVYDTGLLCSVEVLMNLKILWDIEHPNMTFYYDNGTTSGSYEYSSTLTNAHLSKYSPAVLIYSPENTYSKVILKKIKMATYEIS